jgi:uncharacterized caspase-like protein
MQRFVLLFFFMALTFMSDLLACAAMAQKRVALVIGNGKYHHEGQLTNPPNDAREVTAALRRIKFADVQTVLDGDLIAIQTALAAFARRADTADLALIYYSGHGVEVDGKNYLLPTNTRLAEAGDIDFEAVPFDLVLTAADRAGKVKVIVLDACRNNPFQARMMAGRRAVGRGLAAPNVANGMLVAYAARAGTTADDGTPGGTSPFTTAFLKFVEQPNLEVRFLFGRVRDEVVRATRRQEPGIYVSLGGEEVYLNPTATGRPVFPPATAPAITEAERSWARIESSEEIAVFEAFRRQYGKDSAVLDALAASKIAALKRLQEQKLATLHAEDARRKAEAEARRTLEELERPATPKGPIGSGLQACSQEHSLRSLEGTTSTAITFVNSSANTIRTYWIDYQGKRKFYASVAPGSSYVQQTYVTHPWVVTNNQEVCLGVYMPEPSPSRVVVAR